MAQHPGGGPKLTEPPPRTMGSPVQRLLARLHELIASEPPAGEVASYIPELARADPAAFGVAVATADGEVHEVGDSLIEFTIQSISKPLLYGMALEDRGVEGVLARVGVEPTGDAFNSIRLGDTGAPANPMINAGAIAVTGLIDGDGPGGRRERILAAFGRYAGRPLTMDEEVMRSELETGHRNRAIAHLLRNFSIIEDDPEAVLDLYFAQCSVSVTCRDLALMGATLANRGVNPLTGERALEERYVPSVLSVMATCGMYDYAGQWLFDVGLPAKSGVAGGVVALLPGQLGIGALSPPLDRFGNSVRGVRVCRELSRGFALHLLDAPRAGSAAIRGRESGATRRSRRHRAGEAAAALRRSGESIQVHGLQGDLMFTAAAAAARSVLETASPSGFVILDMSRVTAVNAAAAAILGDLRRSLASRGAALLVAGAEPHRDPLAGPAGGPPPPGGAAGSWPDVDSALEWCEERLLVREGVAPHDGGLVALGDTELCRGMGALEVDDLTGAVETLSFDPAAALFEEDDVAGYLFVIGRGRASVVAKRGRDLPVRLLTVGAGMFIGEVGLIDGRPRSASVIAETPVVAYRLTRRALEDLEDSGDVRTRSKVLLNLAAGLSERLRQATAELTPLW